MPIAKRQDSACIFLDVANSDDILTSRSSSGALAELASRRLSRDDGDKPALPKGVSLVQDVISQQTLGAPAGQETKHGQHQHQQESNEPRHSQQRQALRGDDVVDDEGWSNASSFHHEQTDHHSDLLTGTFVKMTRRFSNSSRQIVMEQTPSIHEEENSYDDDMDADSRGIEQADKSNHSYHSNKSDTIHTSNNRLKDSKRDALKQRHTLQHTSIINDDDDDESNANSDSNGRNSPSAISDQEQARLDCIRFAERIVYLEEEIARSNLEAATSKSSVDVVKLQYSQLALEFDDLRKFCNVLQEENAKLREENKELKQQSKNSKQDKHSWFGISNKQHEQQAPSSTAEPAITENKPLNNEQGFDVGDDVVTVCTSQDDSSTVTSETSKKHNKHSTTSTSWFRQSLDHEEDDEDFDDNVDDDNESQNPANSGTGDDHSKCTTSSSSCGTNATITGMMDVENAERRRRWEKDTNGGEFTDLNLTESRSHRKSLEKRYADIIISKLDAELAKPPQPHQKLQTVGRSLACKQGAEDTETTPKKSWWGGLGGSNRSLMSKSHHSISSR
uniref:Uncharacterized protein n=1 Tax=Asterionellopsis glacialis TaxID=33640 RepID=A0A7S0PWY7_9STRA|mmetsp:Transcript_851/g.1208  ORF Transcript_851/g.1208 Transcript_851/m.1208 type:complete len:562 (+) Transcript_851:233-1918(+)